ncbi:zinc finger protein 14-like isoform X8 [Anopheles aquasalis]|uniref:zinc finger protein 14-like isoform X2 n=1 Tax=Anopheles aquasalis TaxID=42839 RepID=UPI00215AA41E|nr:zinc finger protein 14-like isoform X2 [Anopheles aquasalis]XP_050092959.1 zinc finger protein 14-like isoform X3 [Anopheles aquasalis]XP_050092960.1 zinc finger protein 14-like isoform X4 [Anopheles aquasalis]XP_050092961.1 zinc finger protein 14-like isoform X5 [Anopheles aquasalis]XP_050092963.1 zinc finger protein 14-like isoform X7 [Anopheles aquasalis]XP_050092965.1 zinc finger protein 14-like isoform X8 [Anopheles aquasalis]
MEVLGEISNFCRFCLSQDCESLMPLSSAIESLSFSLQDIQETTGISILESEITCLAVCLKCSNRIELAVDFRRSCLNANILFMQLFGHSEKLRLSNIAEENLEYLTYVKNDPLEIEITLQTETTNENTYEERDEPALLAEESQELIEEPTNNGQEDCEDKGNSSEDLPEVSTNSLGPKLKTTNARVAVAALNCRMAKAKGLPKENEEDKSTYPKKRKKSGKARKQLCGICGALVFSLNDHTRSHTKENLLKCPHCPAQMAHASNLLSHVRAVHEKKIIKSCEPCGKGFITYNSYKSHMRSQHNIGERYQCEICLKMFSTTSSRREHVQRIHVAEWKFECQICQKKFKDKSKLKQHENVHFAIASYACSQCPKRFKSPYAKKTHEITHSGIQFPCTICTKVYRYKSLLSMHYRKCHPAECNGE